MYRRGFRGRRGWGRPVVVRPVIMRPMRPWFRPFWMRPLWMRPYAPRPWLFGAPMGLGGCGLLLMLPMLMFGLFVLLMIVRHI